MAYVSKYYDPVKAHEYYMRTRKLKGREKHADTVLNETGKKAQIYVKSKINEEKESKISDENESYKNKLFSRTQAVKVKISSLSKKYSKLSAAQKKVIGPRIKAELEKLKSKNEAIKNELSNQYTTNVKNLKTKYSNLYESEVNKMYNDSKLATAKKKKASNKKTTKKSSSTKKTSTTKYNANWDTLIKNANAKYAEKQKNKKK